MKKLLAALALGAAAVSLSAPAAAQDVRGRVSITIGDNDRYGRDYYGRPQYNQQYRVKRHHDNEYLYWHYFANARSYYAGRCNTYRDVVVQDPFTRRLVCLDRNLYQRYLYERRYNR